MKGKIAQEFMRKEKRLIDLCTEIARILRQSGRWSDLLMAEDLESTARDLSIAQTIDEKKEIVSSIKNGFHKEGIFDWGRITWNGRNGEQRLMSFMILSGYIKRQGTQIYGKNKTSNHAIHTDGNCDSQYSRRWCPPLILIDISRGLM